MSEQKYLFRLYIVGKTANSQKALANSKRLLEEELPGQHELEVIDVIEHPVWATQDEVIATPTLVRCSPPPVCRVIGDLSHREKVLERMKIRVPSAAH